MIFAFDELRRPVQVTDTGIDVGLASGGTLPVTCADKTTLASLLEHLLTRRSE